LIITRRAFTAALSLTGLAALAGLSPFRLITDALADGVADVAKPQSLPDMALGPKDASVTITEYASMTCPHCAAFNETVFPKIKAAYIDTNKIRYVFREFPLDIKAAAGSMLSRCIAKDDSAKYFAVTDLLFKQQGDWVVKNTTETLARIGKQAGLSQQQVETCSFCFSEQFAIAELVPAALYRFYDGVTWKKPGNAGRGHVIKEDEHRPAGQIVAKAGARQGSARQIQAPSQSVAATNGTTP